MALPPPQPPPGPPPPHGHCTKAKNVGCYNDSSFLALSNYQPQLHDKVSFESCASACSSLFGSASLAGIDARNHCYCGKVLVAGASEDTAATTAACFIAIVFGMLGTIVLLSFLQRALPALPISLTIGIVNCWFLCA